jgi:hypothetical protein
MKKIILLLAVSITTFASDNLFVLDENKVSESVYEAEMLNDYLETNEIKTISELSLEEKTARVYNLSQFENRKPLSPMFEGIDDMNWTSFAWGFCCWPVGFIIIILNNNHNNDSKVSYLIGVLAGIFVWGGFFWFGRGIGWWWY